VSNGVAEEIVGVDADIAADVWHTLAVRVQDDRFIVYLDGAWIFTGYDKTFPHAGRIALWAEPGSITRFDHLTMGPTPKSLSWQWRSTRAGRHDLRFQSDLFGPSQVSVQGRIDIWDSVSSEC
jgi:hypothetical protein